MSDSQNRAVTESSSGIASGTAPTTTGRHAVPFRPEEIPDRLKDFPQWVGWRPVVKPDRDKPTKIPVEPDGGQAHVGDPSTWGTYDEALQAFQLRSDVAGIGFVFTDDDPFIGIDIDDCRDPASGDLEAWALEIVEHLDTYTEVSPSGTGLHCLCEGVVPGDRNRRGDVEIYDELRYFTVTGCVLAPEYGQPSIEQRQHALEWLHEEVFQDDEDNEAERDEHTEGSSRTSGQSSETDSGTGSDPEPVSAADSQLLRRAKRAANGEKFRRLWNGDWKGRYPSQSEADLALCTMLAFWTQKDRARMDRLFRQSGLMRAKWDADRGDQTYGELTLEKALAHIGDDEVYDPSYYE